MNQKENESTIQCYETLNNFKPINENTIEQSKNIKIDNPVRNLSYESFISEYDISDDEVNDNQKKDKWNNCLEYIMRFCCCKNDK